MTLTKEEQLYKSYVVPDFSDLMIKGLAEHTDRGDSWKDDDAGALLERAREELEEVAQALEKTDRFGTYSDRQAKMIAHECADAANFFMMIADQVGGL